MTHAYEKVREENYFEDVLRNMRSASGGWTVRFGETGDGVRPNYQIEKLAGEVTRFHGRTHEEFHERPDASFDETRLSQPLTYADVYREIKRCLRPR
jgi:hypothetical protein